MPKIKTRKSLMKRIRFTSTGRIKIRSAFRGHILTKKNNSRKRRLCSRHYMNATDQIRLKKILPKKIRQ